MKHAEETMAASHRSRIGMAAVAGFLVGGGIGYLICWRIAPPHDVLSSWCYAMAGLLGALISSILFSAFLRMRVTVSKWGSGAPLRDQMKSSVAGKGQGTELEALALAGEQTCTALQRSEAQSHEQERRHLEWLAYLAHDLGTPVERIIAGLRAMESIATDEPQRMKHMLSEAERGLRQLSELICSISQLTNLESNIDRNFTTIPLDDILTQLIDAFEFEACSRDIELDLRIVPGIPVL